MGRHFALAKTRDDWEIHNEDETTRIRRCIWTSSAWAKSLVMQWQGDEACRGAVTGLINGRDGGNDVVGGDAPDGGQRRPVEPHQRCRLWCR